MVRLTGLKHHHCQVNVGTMLDYLIDNIFIRVGNKVFRQTVGIPMGTDCAPLLANLFLFYYEYHYMKKLIRDNQCLAKYFNYTVRYIHVRTCRWSFDI